MSNLLLSVYSFAINLAEVTKEKMKKIDVYGYSIHKEKNIYAFNWLVFLSKSWVDEALKITETMELKTLGLVGIPGNIYKRSIVIRNTLL